jgi:transcription termination/antitermination protein NusG
MRSSSKPRWYALAVRSRQEKAAAASLSQRGHEVFLPTRIERHAWSDRVQPVEVALFPGYLFVHTAMSAAQRVDLLKGQGVVELVGRLAGDSRIARDIADAQIDSLKTLVASRANLDPTERLVKGSGVRVASGPFKDAQGVVVRGADGKQRLVVQIELLGRGVSVAIDGKDLVAA